MALLEQRIFTMAERIGNYLVSCQLPSGNFLSRDFYGKAFAALLWCEFGLDENVSLALRAILKLRETGFPQNYHFEFNRYALGKIAELYPTYRRVDSYFRRNEFAGTRVANWITLRAACRFSIGSVIQSFLGVLELTAVLTYFTSKSGLIDDKRHDYSMQYNAFSLAILGDIALKKKFYCKPFLRRLDAFSGLCLPGGQCNYIGRGSLQSFGYSSAILAFSYGFVLTGVKSYLRYIQDILSFLEEHQADDGSLPLVLNGRQEGSPDKFDLLSADYLGWYSYNNYYDYLPFSGALLVLAARQLSRTCQGRSSPKIKSNPNKRILFARHKRYSAVVAVSERSLAANLPFPYLEVDDKCYPIPVYGGEQCQPNIYGKRCLPLPILMYSNGEVVNFSQFTYLLLNSCIASERKQSSEHQRCFKFFAAGIEIVDVLRVSQAVRWMLFPRLLLPESMKRVNSNIIKLDEMQLDFDDEVEIGSEIFYGPSGPMREVFLKKYLQGCTLGRIKARYCLRLK